MNPRQVAYTTVTKLAYPLFKPKLTDVAGLENLPRQGGFLLAANHVDWLDGFYIAVAVGLERGLPVHFLSSTNNYWWTTLTLKIPRHRGEIIDAAAKFLTNGKVICNFLEGQRNPSSQLLPGKTGTVRMALAAGVPVIPVGITCDAGRNMGQSLQFLFSPLHTVTLKFGAPLIFHIPPGGISGKWLAGATNRLMRAIAPLCGKTV
ncbi:MAG: lysophospholipid acyltransferase family protein [Patescibacteria group bacterium]